MVDAGWRKRPRAVFSLLSPPAATAEQHFDGEVERDGEGHCALLQWLRDPA